MKLGRNSLQREDVLASSFWCEAPLAATSRQGVHGADQPPGDQRPQIECGRARCRWTKPAGRPDFGRNGIRGP